MWSRSRRLGLETHQRLISVSAVCVSCSRRYFAQILQTTLIKWSKSAVAIMAVSTRIGNRSVYYLLTEVSGWWSDVMVLEIRFFTTAIIITCRPRPIYVSVTSRDLQTSSRVLSVCSPSHSCCLQWNTISLTCTDQRDRRIWRSMTSTNEWLRRRSVA